MKTVLTTSGTEAQKTARREDQRTDVPSIMFLMVSDLLLLVCAWVGGERGERTRRGSTGRGIGGNDQCMRVAKTRGTYKATSCGTSKVSPSEDIRVTGPSSAILLCFGVRDLGRVERRWWCLSKGEARGS